MTKIFKNIEDYKLKNSYFFGKICLVIVETPDNQRRMLMDFCPHGTKEEQENYVIQFGQKLSKKDLTNILDDLIRK